MAVRVALLVLLITLMHIYCMQSMQVTLRVLEVCSMPAVLLVFGSVLQEKTKEKKMLRLPASIQ